MSSSRYLSAIASGCSTRRFSENEQLPKLVCLLVVAAIAPVGMCGVCGRLSGSRMTNCGEFQARLMRPGGDERGAGWGDGGGWPGVRGLCTVGF